MNIQKTPCVNYAGSFLFWPVVSSECLWSIEIQHQQPDNLNGHTFGGLHNPSATTARAIVKHAALEAGPYSLARHLDQPQIRNREGLGTGAVPAQVAGQVVFKSDNCRPGRTVKEGDVLLRIDPVDFELEVALIASQGVDFGLFVAEAEFDLLVAFTMFEVFGFGKPLDHTCLMELPGVQASAWAPPVRMVADHLGLELDEVGGTWPQPFKTMEQSYPGDLPDSPIERDDLDRVDLTLAPEGHPGLDRRRVPAQPVEAGGVVDDVGIVDFLLALLEFRDVGVHRDGSALFGSTLIYLDPAAVGLPLDSASMLTPRWKSSRTT